MSKSNDIITSIMVGNAVFAIINAVQINDPILWLVAYVSMAPVVIASKMIDGGWLYVHSYGKRSKFLRDMLVWPITLSEFLVFKHYSIKGIKILETLESEGRLPNPDEARYLARVYRKTIKWKLKQEALKRCSTD